MNYIIIIIFLTIGLIASTGEMIYTVICKESGKGFLFLISAVFCLFGIIFISNQYEKTTEHLKKHELSLIRDIENTQKELKKFYIDHPEFGGRIMEKNCNTCGRAHCFINEPEYEVCQDHSLYVPMKGEFKMDFIEAQTKKVGFSESWSAGYINAIDEFGQELSSEIWTRLKKIYDSGVSISLLDVKDIIEELGFEVD